MTRVCWETASPADQNTTEKRHLAVVSVTTEDAETTKRQKPLMAHTFEQTHTVHTGDVRTTAYSSVA